MGVVHRLLDDDEVPLSPGPAPRVAWAAERITPDEIVPNVEVPARTTRRGGQVRETLSHMKVGDGYRDRRSAVETRNKRKAWSTAAKSLGYKIETFKVRDKKLGSYLLVRRIA